MENQLPFLQYLSSMFPELAAWLGSLSTDSNALLLAGGAVAVFILAIYLLGKILWRLTLWVVLPLVLVSLVVGGETMQNFFSPVLKALGAGEVLENVQQALDEASDGAEEDAEEAEEEAEGEPKKSRRRTGPGR